MEPRPVMLHGTTYRIPTPVGTAFIIITRNKDGEPFEVFINIGKGGSDVTAMAEGIGRLISLVFRMDPGMSRMERVNEVIDQLAGIGGNRLAYVNNKEIRSLPDAVAGALAIEKEKANGQNRDPVGTLSVK